MVQYWIEKTAEGFVIMGHHTGYNKTRPIKVYATKKAAENYIDKVNSRRK